MERAISLLSVLVFVFLLSQAAYANSSNETNSSQANPKLNQTPFNDQDSAGVAGIMVTLSESGLNYAKEVLVNEILAEMTPLPLPNATMHVTSPIGRVDVLMSHIELSGANVSYSDVDLGKIGVTVFAGDVSAGIRFRWQYQYTSSYVPFPVVDGGWADVEVGILVFLCDCMLCFNGVL